MEYYNLGEDEVPLYKGNVLFSNQNNPVKFILTNHNFVFMIRESIDDSQVKVYTFPVSEVKEWKGKYQVLKKNNTIEVYFLHNEIEFSFESGIECRKFMSIVLELLTNKNKFRRVVDKVSVEREYVDETLHIDSLGIVKNAVKDVIEHKKVIGKAVGKIKNIGFAKKK